jgi:23S rRNA (adenine2503-C2)-methyltransferase
MTSSPQPALLGLDLKELSTLVEGMGEPRYRASQLFEGLYRQRVTSLEQITTLPKDFQGRLLAAGHSLGLPVAEKKFASVDGTVRYLIGFADGESVETVWMPEGDDGEAGDGSEAGEEEVSNTPRRWKRATICVSSQVGCAVNCQFCLTALLGQKRNLTAGEIVGQILLVLNDHQVDLQSDRVNLVFMGQGEPFLNYENFMKSVRLLADPQGGVGFSTSRMTVSTSGIVSRFADFATEPVRPKLAISLNAPNDAVRAEIMPINRKWDIQAILQALHTFPLRRREKLTFEYVLLGGVNDQPEHARELARLVRGIPCKVNLIAWNPGPEVPFRTPDDGSVQDFQQILVAAGVPAFIRRPRGRDIYAACGQLKRTIELVPLTVSS